MENDKTFAQRQLPFMLNCNPGTADPNAKTVSENASLKMKDVMKCTAIEVKVGESGGLTPEAQEDILGAQY